MTRSPQRTEQPPHQSIPPADSLVCIALVHIQLQLNSISQAPLQSSTVTTTLRCAPLPANATTLELQGTLIPFEPRGECSGGSGWPATWNALSTTETVVRRIAYSCETDQAPGQPPREIRRSDRYRTSLRNLKQPPAGMSTCLHPSLKKLKDLLATATSAGY